MKDWREPRPVVSRLCEKHSLATRFWSRVWFTDDCWEWCGSKSGFGHGVFHRRTLPPMRAHRFAYEQAHGVMVPKRSFVCHHCDNPSCVRPSHLYVGDSKTNARDMRVRGRAKNQHKNKKFCKRGHRLSGKNLGKAGPGLRRCLACCRERYREARERSHA